MTIKHEFWTAERIKRFEKLLARQRDNVFAESFLSRLSQAQTEPEKRRLIEDDLIPLMRHEDMVLIVDGREIAMRLVLRDIVQDFLYSEHVIENRPHNIPVTPEEAAERGRLAHRLGQGKPASEIIIEDRGPR